MTGIYKIENELNGKKYYGSAKDIEKRWNRHKNDLNKNKHQNVKLQRAWNKYGSKNFKFVIMEECSFDVLLIVEQTYLDQNPEYNIGKKSSGGDNLSNNPNKEKIIKKIKKGIIKRYSNLSDEDKMKISENLKGEKNPNWRGGTSKNYCSCGKEISINNKTCRACYNINGENNPNYGKKMSNQQKDYLSNLFKNKHLGNNNKEITISDVEYISFKDAERKLGINWGTIRFRVLSKNPKFFNYNFKSEQKVVYTQEEYKEIFAKEKRGKKMNFNRPFSINGVVYRTLKEAGEILNLSPQTIKSRLKNKKFNNYNYEK